jgi:hypothetical protein
MVSGKDDPLRQGTPKGVENLDQDDLGWVGVYPT